MMIQNTIKWYQSFWSLRILLTISFCTLFSINNCLSQKSSVLQGYVYDTDNNVVDYFNLTLLSTRDSSFIKGGTFTEGYFEVYGLEKQSYLLRLSCVQYLPKDTIIYLTQDTLNLGKICLRELALSEVVVSARKPFFRQELGITKLDVKNSFLKDAGNLIDVFKKSPGLEVDYEGNINVFGKGKPIIFIDNKEVRSKEEISIFQSSNIESIEIDRNPSAEYSASGHAIIKVKTKKNVQQTNSFSLSNYTLLGRKLSNQTNISIQYNNNKFSNYLSFSYQNNSLLQYDKNTQLNINKTDTIYNIREGKLRFNSKPINIFYSFEHEINKKNILGFQYSGIISNSNQTKDNTQAIFLTNESDKFRYIDIYSERKNNLHNFSFNYNLKINDKSNLMVIGDYAFSKNIQNEVIVEEGLNSDYNLQSKSKYSDKYNIAGTRIDFTSRLKFLSYRIGINYSDISNKGNSNFNNKLYDTKIEDQITALFFTIDKTFRSFTIKVGLRGEYFSSNINLYEIKSVKIDKDYFKLYPSLLFSKKISENLNIGLSYSKRISRPNLSQLNPRFRYLDSLSYIVGNPKLEPAFTDAIELTSSIKNWAVSIGYRHAKNQIVNVGESNSENQNIIQYTFINLKKSEYLTGSLSYSYNSKKISAIGGVYFSQPFITIPYLDEKRKLDKTIWRVNVSADYNLINNSYLYCSFNYKSRGESGLTYFEESSNLSFGFRQYLINKKLHISVGCEDILNTYRPNNWTSSYGNITSTMRTNADSQTFYIKVRYEFGNLKMKNQKKSANTDNLNRL